MKKILGLLGIGLIGLFVSCRNIVVTPEPTPEPEPENVVTPEPEPEPEPENGNGEESSEPEPVITTFRIHKPSCYNNFKIIITDNGTEKINETINSDYDYYGYYETNELDKEKKYGVEIYTFRTAGDKIIVDFTYKSSTIDVGNENEIFLRNKKIDVYHFFKEEGTDYAEIFNYKIDSELYDDPEKGDVRGWKKSLGINNTNKKWKELICIIFYTNTQNIQKKFFFIKEPDHDLWYIEVKKYNDSSYTDEDEYVESLDNTSDISDSSYTIEEKFFINGILMFEYENLNYRYDTKENTLEVVDNL